MKKIALFYGGMVTKHLKLIAQAAKKEKIDLDLISYNQVCFDTEDGTVKIRPKTKTKPISRVDTVVDPYIKSINEYDVVFFRTTGKHWEEVDLIVESLKSIAESKRPIIVDPLVEKGKPSFACKAYQMLALNKAGIKVPRTVYGSLWYLYEYMNGQNPSALRASSLEKGRQNYLEFPVILKGSGGDRGTRVFKADNLEGLEKLVRQLRKSETEEGKRYMLQEYIENSGDYRILVLGEKVLGIMKRTSQSKTEFRNNFSTGGKVEISDLPEDIKKIAIESAKVCGLMIAGVDVIYKSKVESGKSESEYYILEVNKGPQFWGFMEATGIDVPREIVKFLIKIRNPSKSPLKKGRL